MDDELLYTLACLYAVFSVILFIILLPICLINLEGGNNHE